MTMIPREYEGQRVGVNGYRVLNLDLDGVCADYAGAMTKNFFPYRYSPPFC